MRSYKTYTFSENAQTFLFYTRTEHNVLLNVGVDTSDVIIDSESSKDK